MKRKNQDDLLMKDAETKPETTASLAVDSAFNRWWHDEGSGMSPKPNEDAEIAWSNGAYLEQLKTEKYVEVLKQSSDLVSNFAAIIEDLNAQLTAWKDAADCSEPSELKSKLERMDKTLDSLSG